MSTAARQLQSGHDWRDDAEALLDLPPLNAQWPDALEHDTTTTPEHRTDDDARPEK